MLFRSFDVFMEDDSAGSSRQQQHSFPDIADSQVYSPGPTESRSCSVQLQEGVLTQESSLDLTHETSNVVLQLNIPQVPIPVMVNLRYRPGEGNGGIQFDSIAYGSEYTASEIGSYSHPPFVNSVGTVAPIDETTPPPYHQS